MNKKGHFEEFWGLATHPTLPLFVSCGNDKTLRLWNLEARRMEKSLDLEAEGFSASFSPNGKLLSVGLGNGNVPKKKIITFIKKKKNFIQT